MDFDCIKLPKFEDNRGFLIEFLKASELLDRKREFGQIYCATLAPHSWGTCI